MRKTLLFILCVAMLFSCAKKNVNVKQIKKSTIDSITDLNSLKAFVKTVDSTLKDFTCVSPHVYKNEELAS